MPESDLRVKSYDHLNFSRASFVQFRASRYTMRLNPGRALSAGAGFRAVRGRDVLRAHGRPRGRHVGGRRVSRLRPRAEARDGRPLAGPPRRRLPVLSAKSANILEAISRREVQVVRGEIFRRIRCRQPAELESEYERAARPPFHVPLTHEVLEPAGGAEVRIVGVVQSAAASQHPLR